MRFKLFSAALAIVVAGAAGAATVEVTPGEDWCGIVNAHGAGDEIVLLAGDHQGPCWFQADGGVGDPLVVRGEGGPNLPRIVYDGAGDNVTNVFSEHLVIRGLAFGPSQSGIDAIKIREGGDILIEGCRFDQVGGISISANSADTYDLVVRGNEFTDLQSTRMYFGCHDGAGACSTNVLIEGNLIDGVDSSNVGYGLEVKVDSLGIVRDNVIHDTKGPGIEIYGSYDLGIVSEVTGNLVIGSRNNGTLEIGGGPCIVEANIVIGGAYGGIYAYDYGNRGLQRGVHLVGNTAVGIEDLAIKIHDWGGAEDLVLANNAAFRDGGAAVSDAVPGVTWEGNVLCATAAECWVDAAVWDFWPAAGSPMLDEGVAPSGGWLEGDDFCGQTRGPTPHAGALERTAGEDGPGPLAVAFKSEFDCPDGGGDDDDAGDDDAGDDDGGDDDGGDDDSGDDDAGGDDDATPDGDCSCRVAGSATAAGPLAVIVLAVAGLSLRRGRRRRA
jgi:Right handed beta helix region